MEKLEDFIDGTYSAVSVGVVVDSTGQYPIYLGSLAQTLSYNGDDTLAYIIVGPDDAGRYFKQTLTYTNGKVTGISAWVKQ